MAWALSRYRPSWEPSHDAETASPTLEHGIRRIVTRDVDVHRFPFLDTVEPLTVAE